MHKQVVLPLQHANAFALVPPQQALTSDGSTLTAPWFSALISPTSLGVDKDPPGVCALELSRGLAELAFSGMNVPGMHCCSAAPFCVSHRAVAFGKYFSNMKPHNLS